jgi:8-oxo-dGTP diphosphatase
MIWRLAAEPATGMHDARREGEGMKREYPEGPIVAVGAVILKDERIVLVQRNREPSRGLWTFPGGAVELGEPIHEAVRREALEETGLVIEVGAVATVIDHVVRDARDRVLYHYVIVDYLARPVGGILRAGSDVSDACWATLADVEALEMTGKAQEFARGLLSSSR